MNVSETLNKAADLIQQHGWTQGAEGWPGATRFHDGKLCLEGGIVAAEEEAVTEALLVAQMTQDDGGTWGEALEAFENYLAENH